MQHTIEGFDTGLMALRVDAELDAITDASLALVDSVTVEVTGSVRTTKLRLGHSLDRTATKRFGSADGSHARAPTTWEKRRQLSRMIRANLATMMRQASDGIDGIRIRLMDAGGATTIESLEFSAASRHSDRPARKARQAHAVPVVG